MTSVTLYSHFCKLLLLAMVILVSSCSSKPQLSNPPKLTTADIYVNQVAFDIQSPKQAVVALPIGEFHIVVNTRKQQLASSTFAIKRNAYFALTAKSLANYFKTSRHSDPRDKAIRINGTEHYANVSGDWAHSGGDQGKHLS